MRSGVLKLAWFLIGFFVAVVLIFGIPLLVAQFGGFGMSAIEGPRGLEALIGPWLYDRWVSTHAADKKDPLLGDEAAVTAGFKHYAASCVLCHGAPSVKPAEFSQGLEPAAPDLWKQDTQEMTDGQLFLVVHDGVRMTGMPAFGPTHNERQIWQIVTFLRHLPGLTPREQQGAA